MIEHKLLDYKLEVEVNLHLYRYMTLIVNQSIDMTLINLKQVSCHAKNNCQFQLKRKLQ